MLGLLNLLHHTALALALVATPLFYLGTLLYRRKFRQVEYEWKHPNFVYATIGAFVLNLMCFILACFFFAGAYDRIHIAMFSFTPEQMWRLSVDSLLLFLSVTTTYMGMQNVFVQYICRTGVLKMRFNRQTMRFEYRYIRWSSIKDYYVRTDYPVTYYHFIVQEGEGRYGRETLKVPFYALKRFDILLETNLRYQQEVRAQLRALLNKISRDMPLD